jgi:cell division protein FtsL
MITKKANKKNMALAVFIALFIIFFLTFYIWQHAESIQLGYKAGDLLDRIEALKVEVEQLESHKASLLSLWRVEQMARQELMMVSPEKEQVVYDERLEYH